MAGRLAAGEMGNGVLLEEMKPAEQKLRDQMYQVAIFCAGDKFDLISLRRTDLTSTSQSTLCHSTEVYLTGGRHGNKKVFSMFDFITCKV